MFHGSEVVLTGATLEPEDLVRLSRGGVHLSLSPEAWERVNAGREVVDNILKEGKVRWAKRPLCLGGGCSRQRGSDTTGVRLRTRTCNGCCRAGWLKSQRGVTTPRVCVWGEEHPPTALLDSAFCPHIYNKQSK